MANSKEILVLTTSSTEGLVLKKHLKPVSAHVVAGTNLFSDFLGGLTDVFGGRSSSYQKQLSSLYNDAIERIKLQTHEIGGNCVIGLNIDMDEISGKGKSMFMITAIGTAVIIEKNNQSTSTNEKLENVGVERINLLRQRKDVLENVKNDTLEFNDETWSFITINQVYEIFAYILSSHINVIEASHSIQETHNSAFKKNFIGYIDNLEESIKVNLIYDQIESQNNLQVMLFLANVIKELYLFDFERNKKLLQHPDFKKQKIGVLVATFDKAFYNKKDIEDLNQLKDFITTSFNQRGELTTKKQLLSSKEKEVWNCECGSKSIDIGEYCVSCNNNLFGFKQNEMKPIDAVNFITQKIELINEYID
jgi:uncharacterized protein YbjQ (UPF0145 family)